eukprot:GHVQ01021885.1.p1 GENE.GHVQ01021885.1~~GHVQ01021885.1.p1  ORF type:complete len:423 (+),score=89.35 GHVQ01021885.1:563-1831(+)
MKMYSHDMHDKLISQHTTDSEQVLSGMSGGDAQEALIKECVRRPQNIHNSEWIANFIFNCVQEARVVWSFLQCVCECRDVSVPAWILLHRNAKCSKEEVSEHIESGWWWDSPGETGKNIRKVGQMNLLRCAMRRLNDESVFPVQQADLFPADDIFLQKGSEIVMIMFVFYEHVYSTHFDQLIQYGIVGEFSFCFEHLFWGAAEHKLIHCWAVDHVQELADRLITVSRGITREAVLPASKDMPKEPANPFVMSSYRSADSLSSSCKSNPKAKRNYNNNNNKRHTNNTRKLRLLTCCCHRKGIQPQQLQQHNKTKMKKTIKKRNNNAKPQRHVPHIAKSRSIRGDEGTSDVLSLRLQAVMPPPPSSMDISSSSSWEGDNSSSSRVGDAVQVQSLVKEDDDDDDAEAVNRDELISYLLRNGHIDM